MRHAIESHASDTLRRLRPSWASTVLLAVLATGSLAAFFLVRSVVGEQEHARLREASSEATAYLDQTLRTVTSILPALGSAAIESAPTGSFTRLAAPLLQSGKSTVAVAARGGRSFEILRQAGSVHLERRLVGPDAALLRRAVSHQLAGQLIDAGGRRTLLIASGAPDGRAVLFLARLSQTRPSTPRPGTAFSDVDVALYASSRPAPSALVLRSGTIPHGPTVTSHVVLGRSRWLLQTSAADALVGSIATWAPWGILGFGLAAAVVATSFVEVVSRRRRYALALVDERTATLEQALEERERLEEAAQKAREEAEAANRSKSEFLSRMSHELRTPLNAVIGFGQLLEMSELDEDERDSVKHILKGGFHLLELINEVLDIARIESGALALSTEPVLVRDLIEDALGLVRPIAEQYTIHLLNSHDSTPDEYVLADRHRLQQILLNLLANAVKYNRLGGSVAVAFARVGATVRIEVTDTGPGIAHEQLDRLFVPFERLGAEYTSVEGTGIGLALSRQLAEAMGGSLGVETEMGRGSTFFVELPVAEGPVERLERLRLAGSPDRVAEPSRPTSHKVLYIEDNLANVSLVRRILSEREGVELVPAMQGRLGVELGREHRPDLVLLDLHLPDISGCEVLQQLREEPATNATPVVIVSADATPGQVQRLLNAGALAYLTKPIEVAALLALIDEHVLGSKPASATGPSET